MKQALLGAAAISAFGYVYFHVHEPKPVTLTATAPVQTPAQFKQLTATELWHLQGECAKLEARVGSALECARLDVHPANPLPR
jgi:hypothetical protein